MKPRGRSRGPSGALAVVGTVALVLCCSCGRGCSRGELRLGSVPVESEAVAVSVRDLLAQPEGERLEWSFTLVCDQPEGCRGALRIEVRYLSRGKERALTATREVDLPQSGEVRIGRSGPLEKVDGVDRVRVTLVARSPVGPTPSGGQPRPTPRV